MPRSTRGNHSADLNRSRSWLGSSLVRISRRADDAHPVARAPHFAKSVQEWREHILHATPDLSSALRSIEESFAEFADN